MSSSRRAAGSPTRSISSPAASVKSSGGRQVHVAVAGHEQHDGVQVVVAVVGSAQQVAEPAAVPGRATPPQRRRLGCAEPDLPQRLQVRAAQARSAGRSRSSAHSSPWAGISRRNRHSSGVLTAARTPRARPPRSGTSSESRSHRREQRRAGRLVLPGGDEQSGGSRGGPRRPATGWWCRCRCRRRSRRPRSDRHRGQHVRLVAVADDRRRGRCSAAATGFDDRHVVAPRRAGRAVTSRPNRP